MRALWQRFRRRPRWQRWSLLLVAACLTLTLGLSLLLRWLPLVPEDPGAALWARFGAVRILDRHGVPLASLTGPEHTRARPVALDAISPWLVQATITLEDKRFFDHAGVDPLAVGRAVLGNLRAGRVTSGASTLTQQLAKWLAEVPGQPRQRTMRGKALESLAALQLEQRASKQQILAWYLNFAPYGGLVRGAEQAAQVWFAKPARDLTAAESALLAVVARAPGRLNPVQHLDRALPLAHALLRRMHEAGQLDAAALRLALDQPIALARHTARQTAPHFAEWIAGTLGGRTTSGLTAVTTTLVAPLQTEVQRLVHEHVARSRPLGIGNAAAVVLDLHTAEVLALVGSADIHEAGALGANNGALALRQPGSTIKPFSYAAGFDAGLDPATLLADVPTTFATADGPWQPGNYGDRYAGPVLARAALASSLNLAALRWTELVGVAQLRHLLAAVGFDSLQRSAEHYGLALVLGDGEVSLLELTAAFAIFGRGGRYQSPTWLLAADAAAGTVRPERAAAVQVVSARAAWWVADILADPAARSVGFGRDGPLELPFWTAAKTGTSKGFRDNWTVAVTDRYAVGVWVGHFSGKPMPGVTGVTGAAPLARDLLLALHRDRPAVAPAAPAGLRRQPVCALSGAAPGPHCAETHTEWLPEGPRPPCQLHHEVLVDRRTGGLAGPSCPHDVVERQVVVSLPPEFADWRARDLPRAPAFDSPLCPPTAHEQTDSAGPRILQPASGTTWLLDSMLRPDEQQVALVAVGGKSLRWELPDGVRQAASGERLLWTPRPGRHTLRVVDAAGRRAEAVVHVEAAKRL